MLKKYFYIGFLVSLCMFLSGCSYMQTNASSDTQGNKIVSSTQTKAYSINDSVASGAFGFLSDYMDKKNK